MRMTTTLCRFVVVPSAEPHQTRFLAKLCIYNGCLELHRSQQCSNGDCCLGMLAKLTVFDARLSRHLKNGYALSSPAGVDSSC